MATAIQIDRVIMDELKAVAGMRMWLQRPGDEAEMAPVRPEPADWPVLARLKRALDPADMLNPGRLF